MIIKLIIHSLFWIFYIVVLFVFSPDQSGDLALAWYEKGVFKLVFLVAGMVYLNDLVLLPRFIKKKQYLPYAFLILGVIFLITYFYCYFLLGCTDSMLLCYYDDLWIIGLPFVFLSFIWMVLEYVEKQKELEKIHSDRVELELKFLKAQINPHVLFNSLNAIYSKAIKEDDGVADLILMLSENLKYVLYQSEDKLVDLEKDLAFIENYLKFQELRTEGINEILYEKEIDSYQYSIAPLILIDFIENAFKHSVYKENALSAIEIFIKIKDGQLEFTCKNEYDESLQLDTKEASQIGLENLKQRLRLIYQDKYVLHFRKKDGFFTVDLKIDLR